MSEPDDLTLLGSDLFVAWQNADDPAGSMRSTIAEYSLTGTLLHSWSVVGHCDGLTADPAINRVIGTVNEDGNSSLFTVDPASASPTLYSYDPPNPLPHGGGTDAISIYHGQILISAAAPDTTLSSYPDVPAVYVATLSGSTASLKPLFDDNAQAAVANVGPKEGQSVTLGLTDPDSNEVVPVSARRFGGAFVLDSQGDQQQIYMGGRGNDSPSGLSVLDLSQSIDDTAWATSSTGTLYVTDGTDNDVVAVTGHFRRDTAYVSATPGDANNPPPNPEPNYLAVLNMRTGQVIRVPGVKFPPKGMIFVP